MCTVLCMRTVPCNSSPEPCVMRLQLGVVGRGRLCRADKGTLKVERSGGANRVGARQSASRQPRAGRARAGPASNGGGYNSIHSLGTDTCTRQGKQWGTPGGRPRCQGLPRQQLHHAPAAARSGRRPHALAWLAAAGLITGGAPKDGAAWSVLIRRWSCCPSSCPAACPWPRSLWPR